MKIGICDYGIGGLGLFKLIRPKTTVDIVYLSDSGYTPYGKLPEPELRTRLQKIIDYFHSQGIQHIAVACNAASTVIPDEINITGVIEHGVNAVIKAKPDKIGVVGGVRTIESNLYKNAFEKVGIGTIQQPAQQLSIKIEAGDINSLELELAIRDIFEPLKNLNYILLGCTHYPVIADKIRAFTNNTQLIDPIPEMTEWILRNWQELTGDQTVEWITTGNIEKMKVASKNAFNLQIDNIQKISL